MRRTWVAALAVCCAGGCVSSGAPATEGGWDAARIDSLDAAMPALLQEFQVPGVAIALVSGQHVQWSGGYGSTGRPGSAVSADAVFQVASLGKPVFAHLVARIEGDHEWRLQDPIHRWSPGIANPDGPGGLSAEELLSHTSGLRYDPEDDRVVLDPAGRAKWSYSGAGFVLLQRALEAAEGGSLEALSASLMFEPLGLRTMSYVAPQGAGHAVGHDRSGNPMTDLDLHQANAASSLYSSASDYARFLISVAGLDGTDPASLARLMPPRATVDERLGMYWGIGWAVELDPNGHATAFHWGSNPGFKSFAMLDPQRQLGLVILTNGDHGLELVERMVGMLDPTPHPLFEFYMLHPDD